MYTGVTTQKNSLGEMAMLLSLFVVWSLLERRASDSQYRSTRQRLGFLVLFGIAAWLLYASESKTAQVAFLLGAGLLAVARSRAFHHRYRLFVSLALGLPAAGFLVMTASHLGASMADLLGRDATFTGRTAIWAVLKGAAINPVLGEGFCVFWETRGDQLMIDEFQTTIGSAHSGYWEVFIDGGILGLFALAFLVAKAAKAAIAQQRHGGAMTGVGMMVLLVVLLLNLSESYFARFGPSWFTFLLVSMAHPSVFNLTPPISVETSPPMIDRAEET